MEGHLAKVFGILGVILSIMVYLAPLYTFHKIYKKKSTEGYTAMAYAIALFSHAIWLYYGDLRGNATTLVSVNSVGCAIEVGYIVVYFYYSAPHDRICTTIILAIYTTLFCIITLLTKFTWKGDERIDVVGWVCLASSVLVYGSTVGDVVKAVRTHNVQFIPITLTRVLSVNAVVWGIYGFAKEDANIWIPDVIGLFLGVAQIVVFLIFRKQQNEEPDTAREPPQPAHADV